MGNKKNQRVNRLATVKPMYSHHAYMVSKTKIQQSPSIKMKIH